MHRLLVHETLVEPAVLAHVEALVGGIYDEGVPVQSGLPEIVQDPSHIVIKALQHLGIVPHISLELELGQVLAFRILLMEIIGQTLVEFIVYRPVFRIKTADITLIQTGKPGLVALPEHLYVIGDVHIPGYVHFLLLRSGAARIVIIEGLRNRECYILIFIKILEVRQPVPMGGLMMYHDAERLRLVPSVLKPFQALVGDYIGHIALLHGPRSVHPDELRIVVVSLARKNLPEIETGRIGLQMKLAHHRSLISGFLQELRECGLAEVEDIAGIAVEMVRTAMFPGKYASSGRTA